MSERGSVRGTGAEITRQGALAAKAPVAALAWFVGAGWLLVATQVVHRT